MKKFVKSKFDNQLESHKLFKKKLNLPKHKKNLYEPKNHTETIILREQDAVSLNSKLILNDNIIKMKKKRKNEPNVQASASLRPNQNENSSSKVQLSNTIDTNYSKDFNCFSQSVDYSSLSHCNTKLIDSGFCSDSSHNIAGKSFESRQKQLKEVVFGYSQENKNISTTMNNVEITDMACTTNDNTNQDLVPSYRTLRSSLPQTNQELEQNNLQAVNTRLSTPANDSLKAKSTESKIMKRKTPKPSRKEKIKRKDSNHVKSNGLSRVECDSMFARGENSSGEKTDITVPNLAHGSTLPGSVNKTSRNKDTGSQSGGESSMIPLRSRMRTRSMGRMECLKMQEDLNHQKAQENIYEKKHVIEVKEETIIQQNLHMTTHFHSKSDTFSCNLHTNNSSSGRKAQGNRKHPILKRKKKIGRPRRDRNLELTSKLQENGDITETILQSNLQRLVEDGCDISMEVNKKNEYEVNKSIKIDNSKTNVHNSIKKKEIIKSECHIEMKKGQNAFDSLKKCEHNAIKTTKKTFVSKTINGRKSINSFKTITEKGRDNAKIDEHLQTNKELVIPLIKLENLTLDKLSQLIHIPHYIENKINISERKEAQYTVRNTSREKCTIIRKQYKVTKIKRKCEKKSKDNLCENEEESMSPAQELDANLMDDNFMSIDQLAAERLREPTPKENTDISSSSGTKEYFTSKAEYQHANGNERTLNESQESMSNKECSNETILGQTNAEIKSSNLETDEREVPTDNEICKGETLQNSKSQLQANKLLQNIYIFYLENKIKRMNGKVIAKYLKCKKFKNSKYRKLKIPQQIAICSRCKQVFNLLQQFSAKTNFTKDEKIQIECTLCNVHMYSLSRFQQHLMDSHLQCEGSKIINKNSYTVDITSFNVEEKLPIYECCCCLKVFFRLGNFKRHLIKVHHTFHNIPTQQINNNVVKYKKKQISNRFKTNVLKKNRIPKTVHNRAEILNRVEDSTNVLNSTHSNVNSEENQIETSGKKLIESSSKKQLKAVRRKAPLYQCRICTKIYKRERMFRLHMSKHETNSNDSTDSEKTLQEILDENASRVKNNADLSYDHSNNALPSVALNEELQVSRCNSRTEETIPEKCSNSDNENTNEERVLEGNDTLDFQCMLHVNCTGTVRTGEKRKQFIKCNVNISKKLKMDCTVQESVNNGTNDNLLGNYVDEPDVMFNGDVGTVVSHDQEEIKCKICNIKFNSHKILQEHMFLLHDSLVEDQEVLNMFDPDLSNNNTAEENGSAEDDENLRSEDNISTGEAQEIFIGNEDRIYENVICEMLSDCSINKRNKKWRCNLCKENFALIRNYLRHKYYIHNDVSVVHVCDNCNKVLTSVAMVNIHRCTNVTSWSCRRCNLEFINGTYLTQHNINYHFETAGPHTCDVCETSFLTQYMLEKHRPLHSPTYECNNVNDFIDESLCLQNDVPHNLNGEGNDTGSDSISDSDSGDDNDSNPGGDSENVTENDKSAISLNADTRNLNGPAEAADIYLNKFGSSGISLESNTEEMFKCKICDIVCLTKKQMMLHLENWHETNAEVCELCNRLYVSNELMEHLVNCHIVASDFDSTENNIGEQLNYNREEDIQHNVVDLLGLERLVILYEYQRFNDQKNNCFNCVVCLMEFLSTQSYRLHYLEFHDTVCLLCNIEFEHQYQAFEHKIKIHVSTDSYLWVVEKLTASILKFNENGSTLEDMILQSSERRVHDDDRYSPESFSLSDNELMELNDEDFFHATENVTSLI